MKLTKKKAIEISIELWTYLAETGKKKEDWDGWERYGEMEFNCALCEYDSQREGEDDAVCAHCPYYVKFGLCNDSPSPYWEWCETETKHTRKKYAQLFLEQLKQL